jgi:hypothetical protein
MARTAYWIANPTSGWLSTPTGAQIKAGKLSNGTTDAAFAGSEAFAAESGTGQITEATAISGASAGTQYTIAWTIWDDVADNYATPAVGTIRTVYLLSCDAVSYSLSGQAADLAATRAVVADAGSYALSGNAADITFARAIPLDAGSYAVTGRDATFVAGKAITLDAGSYVVTVRDATFAVSRAVSLDAGSYSVTGRDATLSYTPLGQFTLSCDAGSYALTGFDATLILSRAVALDAGSYAVTGNDATITKGITIALDAGSYTLTGGDIATSRGYAIGLDAGSYTLDGREADLSYSGAPPPAPAPVKRGAGGSRFVEARKRLPMPFLIDWLTNEEPSEETKRVITEIKAGRPIPRDAKPPKGPENISAERLAREILPYRAFQFETYLSDLVFASRTIEKAVSIARERDDEDILLLL